MDNAKLRLSAEELRLVTDAGFILTKNAIIQKVYSLFGMLADDFRTKAKLPEEVAKISPKIARGENYQGLPYVMFDYPRLFTLQDTMAIRCFFWWGNFFSITLHLKGIYRAKHIASILDKYVKLAEQNYAVAVSNDEWQHDFGNNNYRYINSMKESEFRQHIEEHPFIKISRSFPIILWDNMHDLLAGAYEELNGLISEAVE